ncbi:uncharacterized protein LOC17881967 [Capsella rubella]|uniref:uncharacterized protein LOC17881967 n=1 Tax=Capsella rubella TaxID=81985 RepID=UPI000CD557AF|nr:uncharacterized protein LOC17881967 [Capsella rubella]
MARDEMEEWYQQQEGVTSDTVLGDRRGSSMNLRWCKPAVGKLKCNIHTSWINDFSFFGGAWILRNHLGDVMYHARDAFLPRSNRISAELNCLHWSLASLRDMRYTSCEVWTDCHAAWEAITNPKAWPKYRSQTTKIWQVIRGMREVSFHLSSPKANLLAKRLLAASREMGG